VPPITALVAAIALELLAAPYGVVLSAIKASSDGDGPRPTEPPPSDPNEGPFMPAPNGQLGTTARIVPPVTPRDSTLRRVQLSVEPLYGDFRRIPAGSAPFSGRPSGPTRGGGIAVEVDLRLVHWLWARLIVSQTVHPVYARSSWNEDDQKLALKAPGGKIRVSHLGFGFAYALDLGKILPLLDLGAGLLAIAQPAGVARGQRGQNCGAADRCDLGLICGATDRCEPAALPEVHAGVGLDVLLHDHWAIGAHVRYHALLSAPTEFPVYLTAALRLGLRF